MNETTDRRFKFCKGSGLGGPDGSSSSPVNHLCGSGFVRLQHPLHGKISPVRHEPRQPRRRERKLSQELSSIRDGVPAAERSGGGGRKRERGEEPAVRGAAGRKT